MVTLSDARRVIAAAEKKAVEIRQPMKIVVAINFRIFISQSYARECLPGSVANSHQHRRHFNSNR